MRGTYFRVCRILFRTADLSQVKAYCLRQWSKLKAGDVSPQDFTFAKAVKLGSYRLVHRSESNGSIPDLLRPFSTKGNLPPGAAVATRLLEVDPRAETSYGERVPYILHAAEAKTKQIERAVTPEEFLADSSVPWRRVVLSLTLRFAHQSTPNRRRALYHDDDQDAQPCIQPRRRGCLHLVRGDAQGPDSARADQVGRRQGVAGRVLPLEPLHHLRRTRGQRL